MHFAASRMQRVRGVCAFQSSGLCIAEILDAGVCLQLRGFSEVTNNNYLMTSVGWGLRS